MFEFWLQGLIRRWIIHNKKTESERDFNHRRIAFHFSNFTILASEIKSQNRLSRKELILDWRTIYEETKIFSTLVFTNEQIAKIHK